MIHDANLVKKLAGVENWVTQGLENKFQTDDDDKIVFNPRAIRGWCRGKRGVIRTGWKTLKTFNKCAEGYLKHHTHDGWGERFENFSYVKTL